MKKQIEVYYCDFCEQETDQCQVITVPTAGDDGNITINEKDICNNCLNKLATFLSKLSAEPDSTEMSVETEPVSDEIEVEEKIEPDRQSILRDEAIAAFPIDPEHRIPLLGKPQLDIEVKACRYPPTKICLGGLAHNKSLAIGLENPPPYILDSLLVFPQTFTSLTNDYFQWIKDNNIEFYLDSGVFSYLNNPKKDIHLTSYIERYINFINNYKIDKYFELDLDHIIGLEAVKQIREYLYKHTGVVPIPVWHKSRGREEWTFMCKHYDSIAIGGIASKEILPREAISLITELCDEAHSYNTKVHGLGFALLELLNTYTMPCDSIDTNSWNRGRRSQHCVFEDNQIKVVGGALSYESKINIINDINAWGEFSRFYVTNKGGYI